MQQDDQSGRQFGFGAGDARFSTERARAPHRAECSGRAFDPKLCHRNPPARECAESFDPARLVTLGKCGDAPRSIDLRVSFLLGSAQLTDQAQEEARVFAKALLLPALSSNHFRIEGHTDSSGTRAINLDLSRRRAQAVADYLATLGVQSDRLQVRGYGPDRPLPGHSPRSPENRRVEAQLL